MLGKITGIVLIIVLIVVGASGYQKYSSLLELEKCGINCIEIPVQNIKAAGMDTEKSVIDIPVIIRNPSTKDIEMGIIDFDIYIEGRHLTKGIIPANVLQAKQNTTIWVKNIVMTREDLVAVSQAVVARYGKEIINQGKANISTTVNLLVYIPFKIYNINIYTFKVPIQMVTEIPFDLSNNQIIIP